MDVSPQPVTNTAKRRAAFSLQRLGVAGPLLTLAGALSFTTLLLLLVGAQPLAVYQQLVLGAFENPTKLADATMLAAPLLLCALGLTLTFNAGLYNLGVEGQVALGAVFALGLVRMLPDAPPMLVWLLALPAGMLGGVLWALVAATLKLYGRVSEIFAGLGLNFLARGITLYLVVGLWKKPGVASTTGTELLPRELWLPTLGRTRLTLVAPLLALLALGIVWFVLARTHWGLTVRAAGQNAASAQRLGVPTNRRIIETLCLCGLLAGVAGYLQVLGVHHQLVPDISSGIGFTALLVALLVSANPAWVLPVAALFACFTIGSLRLPLALNIDSSVAGVLQAALALTALVARGLGRKS